MTEFEKQKEIFFNNMDQGRVQGIVADALHGMDDGELFLEYCQSESLSFDDGNLKNASFDTTQGFGLRSVLGEISGYAHTSEISEAAVKRAAETVQAIKSGHNGSVALFANPTAKRKTLYSGKNPVNEVGFNEKVKLLEKIDDYIRSKNPLVKQVSVSLSNEWQVVSIIRPEFISGDIRPLTRLNIAVVVEKDGRMERGSFGGGGRGNLKEYLAVDNWQYYADEALRQALLSLESVEVPAGEMDVVLGPGWPGIILHEAIGHGLEGDFNRKRTSAFSELMGKQIASKGVTVVDDGTIADRRGSISIDDEGTPCNCTTLIEDGVLVGYMQDRLNARLMGVKPTGNGRRESYEFQPLPRMTNTYMLNSDGNKEDMISSVKNGIYAVSFGGGQVDITSGKFVFSASEAYKIENGKVTEPVKDVTLIGNGPDVLMKIAAVGNDMMLDSGIGTCGKDGQGVPVGVGQPTMLINNLTVGGTKI